MSYRSKRTRTGADQPLEPNKSSSTMGTQLRSRTLPATISALNSKKTKPGATTSVASQPPSLHARNLSTNHEVIASTFRPSVSSTPQNLNPPNSTNLPLSYPFRHQVSTTSTMPSQLEPSPLRPAYNIRLSSPSNTLPRSTEPSPLPCVNGATSPQNVAAHMDPPVLESMTESDESDHEASPHGNEQIKVKKSKPARPRCLRSRSVVPDWPEKLKYDEKEEVLTIDAEGNNTILSGPIQPRDIDNLGAGVKCVVHFNEFNQPIRKGGFVLVKYLGELATTEKFCPIGEKTWPQVNEQYKADIVKRVREKFALPDELIFNKAILMRVGKHWRQYKHELKTKYFLPTKKTKEQIFNDGPLGHSRHNWIRLVEYWYSAKSEKLSKSAKEARASQTHVHTTGCTSYANKRVDFEEANVEVEELVRNSSPTKSRIEIENEVFDKLMYEKENPKRPVGYGFGVKGSSVFGVHGMLRKEGYGSTSVIKNSTEVESMKVKMATMEKENQELRATVEKSNSRLDQSSQILLQALNALRTGKVTDELFEAAQLALRTSNSQVASASSGDSARNGLDNFQTSNSPN